MIDYIDMKSNSIKLLVALSFLIFLSNMGFAQEGFRVQGLLRDSLSRVVSGATVQLISEKDTLGTSSSTAGTFSFDNVKAKEFSIQINSIGFKAFSQSFTNDKNEKTYSLPPVTLIPIDNLIEEVVVEGRLTIQIKGDTVEYDTKNLKLREDALVEDALKRLEGVEVDKDGNVKSEGEDIKRIRINGKDFFGGDVKTATKNLPADIIRKIQVVDDYGDIASMTGDKSGESEKVLNIVIDPDKNNGFTSTIRAGYGTDDRYQATASYMGMTGNSQLGILGNLNNVNAQLFDFNTTGGGARRGRGPRGGGGGGMWGGSEGLTNTSSIGINYRKDFNEQVTVYGSYSFGRDDRDVLRTTRDFYDNTDVDSILNKFSNSDANTLGTNHRLEANLEWKPNDANYVKISPQLSLGNTKSSTLSDFENILNDKLFNSEENEAYSNSRAPRLGVSGLFLHKFKKEGRNIYVDANLRSSATKEDQDRIIETLIADPNNAGNTISDIYRKTISELDNKSWNAGANLTYSEPLSDLSRIQFTYDYNVNTYDNNRSQVAFDEDNGIINDDLYNFERFYDYSFSTHRLGASYNFNNEKLQYTVGASVEPTLLSGGAQVDDNFIDIHRKGFRFVPIARFEYKFSRQKSLQINYNGSSNEPSITQIQPFTDSSNPTSIVTGNPDLDAEFGHNISMRFRNSDFQSGKTFFMVLRGSTTQNKIVSNVVQSRDPELGIVQETQYMNADGTYNLNSFYHYGRSWKDQTYNLSFMGGGSYNNNVAFTDFNKNIARNWMLMQGVNFRYTPTEELEVSSGVRYSWNNTNNSFTDRTTTTSSWTPNLYGSYNITPTWVFGADLSKSFYKGSGFDENPFIINAYVEKKLLQANRGAIRLSAFDLLDEQVNISRTNVEALNLISDVRTNRLGQYFMLTFTYKISKFAGGIEPGQNNRRRHF